MSDETAEDSNNYLNFLLLFQELVKNDCSAVDERIKYGNDFHKTFNNLKLFPHVDKIGELVQHYKNNAKKVYEVLNKHNAILMRINYLISIRCKHEWVHDTIDLDLDTSQQIQYCAKCNKTKK